MATGTSLATAAQPKERFSIRPLPRTESPTKLTIPLTVKRSNFRAIISAQQKIIVRVQRITMSQDLANAGADRTNALWELERKLLLGRSLETVDGTDPAILLLPLSQQLVSRKLADAEKLIGQGLGEAISHGF